MVPPKSPKCNACNGGSRHLPKPFGQLVNKGPKRVKKWQKNLATTDEKGNVTVKSEGFRNEKFGRHVTRNMPCQIDRNGTVGMYNVFYVLILYLPSWEPWKSAFFGVRVTTNFQLP